MVHENIILENLYFIVVRTQSSTNTRVIMYTVKLNSCVRGYHVYKENWTAGIGEVLSCARDRGNREDPYAVAIKKEGSVVGHVPRAISCICTIFIRKHGTITCTITGTRRFSSDLPQGGLELPCEYTFSGSEDIVRTTRKRIMEENTAVNEVVLVKC